MKRRSPQLKAAAPPAALDPFKIYTERLYDHHQQEWQAELLAAKPEWIYLLGVHLRLVELEQLEPAVRELL